jgi:hypothetical protein
VSTVPLAEFWKAPVVPGDRAAAMLRTATTVRHLVADLALRQGVVDDDLLPSADPRRAVTVTSSAIQTFGSQLWLRK